VKIKSHLENATRIEGNWMTKFWGKEPADVCIEVLYMWLSNLWWARVVFELVNWNALKWDELYLLGNSSKKAGNHWIVKVHLSLSMRWKSIGVLEVPLHSFLTSALNLDDWSTPCPCRFNSCKQSRIPLYKTLGGTQSRSGCFREEAISHPCQDLSFGSSSPQRRHYIDCALFAVTK